MKLLISKAMVQDLNPDRNLLFYGDNLDVIRGKNSDGIPYFPDSSVDLIYLDPPFNSRQNYNVLFAESDGARSASQITAFKDTWEWNLEAERNFLDVVERSGKVAEAMLGFRRLLGNTDMLAYLAMMAPRLIELRRVLKGTGSIYLHCDPTASHYLKLLLDAVFGPEMFRNEITWKRTPAHSDSGRYGANTDTIFFYTKSQKWTWNPIYIEHEKKYKDRFRGKDADGRAWQDDNLSAKGLSGGGYDYTYKGIDGYWRCPLTTMKQLDEEGRLHFTNKGGIRIKRYLDENQGASVQALWTDIPPINSQAQERLGYPTQKPEALLERILRASSNEGDVVLDPFCGCGTTIQVAQKMGRSWKGIDITHLAIGLIKGRLDSAFGPDIRRSYDVVGEPTDVAGAKQLALENKHQFQYWALGLCGARPSEGMKKGADRGIDGRMFFEEARSTEWKQIIFSVKGGLNVGVSEVRDLIGVLQREKAEMGVYISFAEPTKPMQKEAAEAGFYTSADGSRYPRLQLLTIKGLIEGTQHLQRPLHVRDVTFKKAPKSRQAAAENLALALTGGEDFD